MIDLKMCRYKGVEFLFDSMPTTGGNRLVKFNYPGSDKQSVERQGKAPRTFTITAIIPHDDYYRNRDELLRVLDDGLAGTLSHPTFGEIENIINGVYTLTEKITELGRATITIPFEVDDAKGIPIQSEELTTQVQAESTALNDQIEVDLDIGYEVEPNNTGNFADAETNLGGIVSAFNIAADSSAKVTSKAAEYKKTLKEFNDNIRSFIREPVTGKDKLSSSIVGLFTEIGSLFDLPADAYAAYKKVFDFGNEDVAIKENTFGRIERSKNRKLIKANVKAQSLSFAYVEAVQIDYGTTDDLDIVQDELETQYLDIRNNQLMSNEALEHLDILRVVALKALDDARVGTRRIITIETKRRPLSVLIYAFYGNTDLMDVIADINNIKQNAFVEGEIKILSI